MKKPSAIAGVEKLSEDYDNNNNNNNNNNSELFRASSITYFYFIATRNLWLLLFM